MEPPEDRQLIDRARDGDQRAFAALVRTYEDLVYRFAFHVCRDEEKAGETLQDTFINVFRKLKQFDGKSKFTTWLYRIVVNNCLMKRRRRKMDLSSFSIDQPEGFSSDTVRDERGRPVQTIPSWKETPLDRVMGGELREILDRAIQRLPMEYRVVFVLRDVEEQSAIETSKILGISIPAVKSRLRRARMFLREQLHGYMKT